MKLAPKAITILSMVCAMSQAFAQDTTNKTDEKGLRQGYWVHYGRDFPDSGYADTAKIMEGRYENNRKEGKWIKYHENGSGKKLVGYYKENKASGSYVKYNSKGICIEKGSFQSGHYVDTLRTFNDKGDMTLCIVFDQKGREREMVYPEKIDLSTPQSKQAYGEKVSQRRVRQPKAIVPPETVPRGSIKPASRDGKKKKPRNGRHAITIRRDERIEQIGEFKNGILYTGVERHYNQDGELVKTLFFEEGRYIEKDL